MFVPNSHSEIQGNAQHEHVYNVTSEQDGTLVKQVGLQKYSQIYKYMILFGFASVCFDCFVKGCSDCN